MAKIKAICSSIDGGTDDYHTYFISTGTGDRFEDIYNGSRNIKKSAKLRGGDEVHLITSKGTAIAANAELGSISCTYRQVYTIPEGWEPTVEDAVKKTKKWREKKLAKIGIRMGDATLIDGCDPIVARDDGETVAKKDEPDGNVENIYSDSPDNSLTNPCTTFRHPMGLGDPNSLTRKEAQILFRNAVDLVLKLQNAPR